MFCLLILTPVVIGFPHIIIYELYILLYGIQLLLSVSIIISRFLDEKIMWNYK